MNIREQTERNELKTLSEFATFSVRSKGRKIHEEECSIRTIFHRDRDRIVHSKAFRRLMHKTQVFLSPEGDHYRTRLTHTLEVAQIARTIAKALRLNEDLTEAIALGHDLGHTPFGHCGEEELNLIHEGGFKHNEQSLRVVDFLEKRKSAFVGLNLAEEVRDGILHHNGPGKPFTMEGQIVKLSDRIAYINHDIDDAIRAGILNLKDIPSHFITTFGATSSKRINIMIHDVIEQSTGKDEIIMSESFHSEMNQLRAFMFKNVYLNPEAKGEEDKAQQIIRALYEYFANNPEKLPDEYYEYYLNNKDHECIKDYIAGMSDRYAINKYKSIFIPTFWS